jgi:hypothetical protein
MDVDWLDVFSALAAMWVTILVLLAMLVASSRKP